MMRAVLLYVLVFCASLWKVDAQTIRFTYRHALTASGTTVDIVREGAEARVVVSWINYRDSISSAVDTAHSLTVDQYNAIVSSINSIDSNDVARASQTRGRDGTTCTIECDPPLTPIHYVVWSPDINTKERGSTQFLATCKLILTAAKLKPSKYF